MLKQSKRVTIKRVLAAFLAIVMCFGMLPDSFGGAVATVYAATENEVTYSFKDGDVIGEYGSENPLTGGATVSSADGVVTLVGNNKMYYHGASHGITFGKNDAIKVKVAGDATIKLEACKYTNGQATGSAIVVTGLADGASVTPEEADFTATTDGNIVTFEYEGAATELVFTYNTNSSAYLHALTVSNPYIAAGDEEEEPTADGLLAPAIGVSESADFTSDLFGTTGAISAGTVIMSTNKYIEATVPEGSTVTPAGGGNHGLALETAVEFRVKVPANAVGVLTLKECQWASANMIIKKDNANGETVLDTTNISAESDKQDVEVCEYTNTTDEEQVLYIKIYAGSLGYVHGMTWSIEEVPNDSVVPTDELLAPAIGVSESADFTVSLFGQTDAINTETVIMSTNKYIEATVPSGSMVTPKDSSGHGLAFSSVVEFRVKVPANAMGVLSLTECQYSSENIIVRKDNAEGDVVVSETSIKNPNGTCKETVDVCKYINDTEDVQVLYIKLYSGGTGYVHGMTWAIEAIPQNATVNGTVPAALNGENLVFTATDGANVVAAITDGAYSVELPVGATYTISFEKGIYKVTSGSELDLTEASAGDTVTGPAVAYEELANRLVCDSEAITWDFTKNTFGAYGHTSTTWYSGDGLVIDGAFTPYSDISHGTGTKTSNTFTINVPAGLTTITFNGCRYDQATKLSLTCGEETKEVSLIRESSSVDPVVPVTFTTTDDASIVIAVTAGGGYLHSISAKTETVQPVATVTGTVDVAANGEVLNFVKDGATIATATIADGKYTVELSVGSSYTVVFDDADTYEILTGATVDLTEAAVGSTVTNNITYSAWDAAKTFSVKIGDTTFNVTPGASKATDFIVVAADGSGSVELATEAMALVWADLGGDGKGVLSNSNVVTVSDNISVSFEGNIVTVTYTDTATNPTSYQMTVKDNSASGVPAADDKQLDYDFRDGSIISKLYTGNRKLATSVKSADGLVTVTSQGNIFYNGSQHGIVVKANDSISVKVAGSATISFSLCAYAGENDKIIVSGLAEGGSVDVESVAAQVSPDGATATFKYTGDATTLVFTYSGSTGYIHSMNVTNLSAEAAQPKDATVSGTAPATLNGEKLVFTAADGTKVVTAIADGKYSVALPIGVAYTVSIEKGIYKLTSDNAVDLTASVAGDVVAGPSVTYEELDNRLKLDANETTWNFENVDFGAYGHSATTWYSGNGLVIDGVFAPHNADASHGVSTNTRNTFTINVPAGLTTITFNGCRYDSRTKVTLTCGEDTKEVSLIAESSAVDPVVPVTFTTDADASIVVTVTAGGGYLHSISAKTETVQPVATVTGTVDTAVNGEVLNFIKDGATIATAIIADGKYSVELSVGSSYTIAFDNADTYEMLTGATVDLTEAEVGSTVTNNITYVAWDAAKAFSVKIGDTTFDVMPGSTKADDFVVAVAEGSGSVELSTEAMALVWANLGGNGKGVLSSNNVAAVSDNITLALNGNVITVTYTDVTTNPASYQITVKDNSASGVPVADGTPVTYNFTDGSIISELYTNSRRLAGGNSVKSTDGIIKVTGQSGIYYNGATHGVYINANDSISVNVAGDATISFALCAYAGDDGKITVSGLADNGSVDVESIAAKAATDGGSAAFEYKGDATTLVFTYTGKTGYIHNMAVTNKVKASAEANPQEENPVIKDYASADKLEAVAVGQRLILDQTGGMMTTVDGAIDSSISYFGFDATSDFYKLEADVVLNACGASNGNGVYFGAFDGTNIATVAIRNSTGLRGIYSKNVNDMAGAGIIDKVIEAGQKVHFVAQKTAEGFVITATPEGGETYSATFKYNNSGYLLFANGGSSAKVSYGFAVANASATVTNMKYYKADGTCVYDQNDCYAPEGTMPVVSGVTAEVDERRESLKVSWTSSTAANGDGRYVVEVSKDGGEWSFVKDTTDASLVYPITEAGAYTFRVCGKLGEEGECNEWVVSEALNVIAAMPTPEVSISSTATTVRLSWNVVNGAVKYEVYRYSFDEGAENASVVATVTTTSYTDTAVTAEMPYYYSVKAYSEDNCSNPSEYVWAVPSAGHTSDYVYEDKATEIIITKKSYDTVFNGEAVIDGVIMGDGTLKVLVNGAVAKEQKVSERDKFNFTLALEEGRNDVELLFVDYNGKITRKTYNFVYLTNYDIVVDAAYTGEAGVAVNGIPTYKTVQAAVDSVSDSNNEQVVILVMAGSYNERLVVNKPYVSIIGEDREATLIHCYPADLLGSDYEAGGDMTKRCATYVMSGATGFSAENISFANDYVFATADGKSNKSADAFRCDADNATFVNVKFVGVQDTLYMHSGHQYYYKCRIEGLVDFIYSGDEARSFFNDCEIVFVYESSKKSGYVTAPRTAADAPYGITFYNCVITSEDGCTGNGYLLARPWGADAYATWINCYMGDVLYAELPYNNMSGNLYEDARFYEYGNYGPGYAINSVRKQISPAKAAEMVTDSYLGWSPDGSSAEIADAYIGDVVTDREPQYDINDVVIPEPEMPEYDDIDEDEENREHIEALYWSGDAGWKKVGNDWYYFDATGSLETGWVQNADDKWYYMNDNGKMATGWVESPESGLWYYMDKGNGHMMSSGWLCDSESNRWYYLDPNGAMCTGWIQLDGTWYLLDNNGSMCTGWNLVNGKWYLLGSDGVMLTGWQQVGGKYYYMTTDGDCLINTTTPDGHKVDENGARVD